MASDADCLPVRLAAKNGCTVADFAGRGTCWYAALLLATDSSSLSNVRSIEDEAGYDEADEATLGIALALIENDGDDAEEEEEEEATSHKLGSTHRNNFSACCACLRLRPTIHWAANVFSSSAPTLAALVLVLADAALAALLGHASLHGASSSISRSISIGADITVAVFGSAPMSEAAAARR